MGPFGGELSRESPVTQELPFVEVQNPYAARVHMFVPAFAPEPVMRYCTLGAPVGADPHAHEEAVRVETARATNAALGATRDDLPLLCVTPDRQ